MADKPGPGRFPFIDALRGLAVAVMIETHTVNALLDQELRRGRAYDVLTFVNGLVAPAFLFCAGLGLAVFVIRRNDDVVSFGPAFRSSLGRAFFIVLLGYSLHLPVFSLRGMLEGGEAAWRQAVQVDVLQVIGVTLALLLIASASFARSFASRIAAAALLAGGSVLWGYFSGAAAGSPDPGVLPAWVMAYASREISPLFTLVPWAAFLAAGFIAGLVYVRASAAVEGGRRAVAGIAVSASAAVCAALVVSVLTFRLYRGDAYWYWSAEYVLIRLGAVALVMSGLWLALRQKTGAGGEGLALLGRESLAVYYVHLMIVYGKDFRWSFVNLWPEGGSYLFCLLLSVLLTGGMLAFAWGWSSAKRARPALAAWGVRALVAVTVAGFLLG